MIVVKIGGSAIENLEEILADLPEKEVIIVHGGGREVTKTAEGLEVMQKFIVSPNGFKSRITDIETMKVFRQVISGINMKIAAILKTQGKKPECFCAENCIASAKRKENIIAVENGRKILVEGGFTGKITGIGSGKILNALNEGKIPVIAPLALGENSEFLNIDGDSLATFIATSINTEILVFFTDKDGILDEKGSTIKKAGIEMLSGIKAGFGMNRKIREAGKSTAKKIIIANGLKEKPFSHYSGTVISNEGN